MVTDGTEHRALCADEREIVMEFYLGLTPRASDLKVVQPSTNKDNRMHVDRGIATRGSDCGLGGAGIMLYKHGLLDDSPSAMAQLSFQQELEFRLFEYRRYVDMSIAFVQAVHGDRVRALQRVAARAVLRAR